MSVALATPTKSRESLGPPLPVRFRLRVVLAPVYSVGGAVVGLVPSFEEEEEEEDDDDECILFLLPVGRVGKKAARAGRDGGAIREVVQKPPSPARASVEPDTRSSMTTMHAWVKRRKRRPPTAATGIYLSISILGSG